jgi:hypothetical protein
MSSARPARPSDCAPGPSRASRSRARSCATSSRSRSRCSAVRCRRGSRGSADVVAQLQRRVVARDRVELEPADRVLVADCWSSVMTDPAISGSMLSGNLVRKRRGVVLPHLRRDRPARLRVLVRAPPSPREAVLVEVRPPRRPSAPPRRARRGFSVSTKFPFGAARPFLGSDASGQHVQAEAGDLRQRGLRRHDVGLDRRVGAVRQVGTVRAAS